MFLWSFFIIKEVTMSKDVHIYKCQACGNTAAMIVDTGVPMMCCGMDMDAIEANTVDASAEKHVPVISLDGNSVEVCVGSVAHPMTQEHCIEWIIVQTKQGRQSKYLSNTAAPAAKFLLTDGDSITTAYAYCNLHGLWKAEK
jgi:superoxide reductase